MKPVAFVLPPGIQASALSSLSKLAGCDPLLSQAVVSCGVLDSVVLSMSHESSPVQAGANMVLAAVAGSSVDFARRVLEAGEAGALADGGGVAGRVGISRWGAGGIRCRPANGSPENTLRRLPA